MNFAIFGLPPKNKELEIWPIYHDELVLCVSPHHPWASREAIQPAELCEAEWVLREPDAATRRLTESRLSEHGIEPDNLNVVMVLGCPEGVVVGVENGCWVSFVSRIAIQRSLALGRIKMVPVQSFSIHRSILMAYNPKGASTRIQVLFREFIASMEGQKVIATIVDQATSKLESTHPTG